jgi:hypothetical protein
MTPAEDDGMGYPNSPQGPALVVPVRLGGESTAFDPVSEEG